MSFNVTLFATYNLFILLVLIQKLAFDRKFRDFLNIFVMSFSLFKIINHLNIYLHQWCHNSSRRGLVRHATFSMSRKLQD